MDLRVGTSGYSYKQWKGPFYPEDLPARSMLSWYADKLPAVEINNTFYRLPKASVLESWAGQVGPEFRFALKASRRITHFKRLKEAEDETDYLLRTCKSLGSALGVVLFQLPPNLPADPDRLARFLDLLPERTRAAFEFRHASWLDSNALDLLRERNLATVLADDADSDSPQVIRTADWGYLRLRRPDYARADLARWATELEAQDWSEAFVFFKHEEEGAGPRIATEFLGVAERVQERRASVRKRPQKSRREAG